MGNVLRDYRIAAKMTRKELSEKSRIRERTIRAYETGTRDLASASLLTVFSLGSVLTELDDDLTKFFNEVIKNANETL